MKCHILFSGKNKNKSTASGAIYTCSPFNDMDEVLMGIINSIVKRRREDYNLETICTAPHHGLTIYQVSA